MSFDWKDGYLYCEDIRVQDILDDGVRTPFYLYSLADIDRNYRSYADALADREAIVAYALKANGNLHILRYLSELGAGAVLVSGGELRLAQAAGFDPKRTVFNGNGKTAEELTLAIGQDTMVNIDSEFDLEHIRLAARAAGRRARVLLRVNPDIDPEVHPYVSTGVRSSKFGVDNRRLDDVVSRVRSDRALSLVGLHCHLGSTIVDVSVFREAASLMMRMIARIESLGLQMHVLNIGGGLGIDYEQDDTVPSPLALIESIRDVLPDRVMLIVEPGRSIVGPAGALIGRVIGVKRNGEKRFIVTDASMTELIRPSLYGAYHHIAPVAPSDAAREMFDVVGPVCESGDFMGRDRRLPTLAEGAGLAIFDVGAYGYVMSSNYNARPRPAEFLVQGSTLRRIRRAEEFEDQVRLFDSSG